MVPRLAHSGPPFASQPPLANEALPPLVRHRVAPPPLDGQVLQRPRAQRLLERARDRRLTLVAAPAGFGKTTMLSTWAASSSHRVAWMALSPLESDPAMFASLLTAAVQQVGAQPAATAVVNGDPLPEPQTLVALALNAVAALDEPVALVLDGYEAVGSVATQALVAFMVQHAPPVLRFIIASRGEPALPLALLRARRQLAELRTDELRWNLPEASSYLNGVLGLALSPDQIAELLRRTEGWVTGLQLAALAVSKRPEELSAFGGAHRFVADYFVGEVLERQPEPLRSFLLHSATLPELSGPLVEAALLELEGEREALLGGYPSGEAALEAISRQDLFLTPDASRPGRYRYHTLFAEAMQARLEQLAPGRGALLRQWAADCLARGSHHHATPALRLPQHPAPLIEPLSEREQEVLGLIAAGRPNREIADLLSISESTVKTHLKHVFAKLDARNRTEAVAIGRRLRIITQ
ncbi:MAG: hypothetical protein OHK0015_05060 [Chloroflexi bacterium OHK40]